MNEFMGKNQKKPKEELATEWDFSDGFGGLPAELDLTQNLGCVPDRKKKPAPKSSSGIDSKKKAG
jgi:hypothetical protein